MKKVYQFVVLALLSTSTIRSQNADTLKVFTTQNKMVYAGHVFTPKTTVEELKKMMGAPDRVEQSAGKDRWYLYDKLGLSFDAGRNGIVISIAASYESDGDKRTAKEKYAGVLMIDNYVVNQSTTGDNIKQNTQVKEMNCVPNLVCISDKKLSTMRLAMSLNNKSLVTVFAFEYITQ